MSNPYELNRAIIFLQACQDEGLDLKVALRLAALAFNALPKENSDEGS